MMTSGGERELSPVSVQSGVDGEAIINSKTFSHRKILGGYCIHIFTAIKSCDDGFRQQRPQWKRCLFYSI